MPRRTLTGDQARRAMERRRALDKKPTTSYLKSKGMSADQIKKTFGSEPSDKVKNSVEPNRKINRKGGKKSSRAARRHTVTRTHATIHSPNEKGIILLTGGLGDVIQLESHFSDEQRSKIHTILYATSRWRTIESMFKKLTNYPKLRKHIPVWDDWRYRFDFSRKEDVIRELGSKVSAELKSSEDWSIGVKFRQIDAGYLKFNGSSLLQVKSDVSNFNLPDSYFVICPFSKDKRIGNRDFKHLDWEKTIEHLEKYDAKGVVINHGGDVVPKNDQLINLTNKTSFIEASTIIQESHGYIGIDTCWSTLAAQIFEPPRLVVKSVNGQCYQERHIYFAPQNNFKFMGKSISEVLARY
jgi:hypothetical protein